MLWTGLNEAMDVIFPGAQGKSGDGYFFFYVFIF